MNDSKQHWPVYADFIRNVQKGFSLLDERSQKEVGRFVQSQQHQSGAFVNRGGNPDLYYSLFGAWISEAIGLEEQKNHLLSFFGNSDAKSNKLIDRYALLLIRLSLNGNELNKPNPFLFLKSFFYSNQKLNTAYRVFLFLLSFDAFYGRNKVLYFMLKMGLKLYKVPVGVPCSYRAAWLMAKQIVGIETQKDIQGLLQYYENGIGFKAFIDADTPDLLSTAVALFVLKRTKTDLRMIAPGALNLVQQNYDSGAFLAGNGDRLKDLEYTFYGLLILGILSE